MPTLPKAPDRARTSALPTPFQSPGSAGAPDRAAARATQQIGGEVAQVVHTAQQEELDKANEAQINVAMTEMRRGFTGLSAGPDGYENVRAQDAIDGDMLSTYGDKADALMADVQSRYLKTDHLRALAARGVADARARFDLGVNRHYSAQTRQADVNATVEAVAQGHRDMVDDLAAGDVPLAVSGMNSTIDNIEASCDRNGQEEVCDSTVIDFTSGAITEGLLSRASAGSAADALSQFNDIVAMGQHRGRPLLTDKHERDLRDTLTPETKKQAGRGKFMEDYRTRTAGGKDALDFDDRLYFDAQWLGITDPAEADAYRSTRSQVTEMLSEQSTAAESMRYSVANARIEAGLQYHQLTLPERLAVSPEHQKSLLAKSDKLHKQMDVRTNWGVVAPLLRELTQEQFAEFPFEQHEHQISTTDIKGFVAQQVAIRNGKLNVVSAKELIKARLDPISLSDDKYFELESKMITAFVEQGADTNALQTPIIDALLKPTIVDAWWGTKVVPAGVAETMHPSDVFSFEGESDVPAPIETAIKQVLAARTGDANEPAPSNKRVMQVYTNFLLGTLDDEEDADLLAATAAAIAVEQKREHQERTDALRGTVNTVTELYGRTPPSAGGQVILSVEERDDGEDVITHVPPRFQEMAIDALTVQFGPSVVATQSAIRDQSIKLWANEIVNAQGVGVVPKEELESLRATLSVAGRDIDQIQIPAQLLYYYAIVNEIGLPGAEASAIMGMQDISGDPSPLGAWIGTILGDL